MTEKIAKYLSDIQLAISLIEEFLVGIENFTTYQSDRKTQSAVERQLGIIGEAVNKIRQDETVILKQTKQIVDFRNRIIHSYDNIDATIVWTILKKYLPALNCEVEEKLKDYSAFKKRV